MAEVELVWHEGGASLNEAREALYNALLGAGANAFWTEWHTDDSRAPRYAQRLPQLVVFINGRRIDELSPEVIRRALERKALLWPLLTRMLPIFLLAITPKCPLCWAGYTAVAAALGLQASSSHSWLVGALSAAVASSVACLWLRPSRLGAALATAGATMLIASRFVWQAQWLAYFGTVILIAGFLGSLVVQPRVIRRAGYEQET